MRGQVFYMKELHLGVRTYTWCTSFQNCSTKKMAEMAERAERARLIEIEDEGAEEVVSQFFSLFLQIDICTLIYFQMNFCSLLYF